MNSTEAICAVLRGLARAGLPHMVTGGLAANHYGVPRSTKDADIVLQMEPVAFATFAAALPPALTLDAQISFETITGSRRHIITIERTNFRIELFLLGDDEHHLERFRSRVHEYLADIEMQTWIPRAEDLIIQKLRWFRPKDQDDLVNIIGVQAETLDWPYIESWADRHGTRGRLEQIRASIPPLPPLE